MSRKVLPLALLLALACEKPGVAPGLDENTCGGAPCAAPGVISGSLVYAGTARGDAVLLLFDTQALPPPDGNGASATAVARIPQATLFGSDLATASVGPFSAAFTFTQVPSGRSYQVRAFIDATHDFDPFFDFTQQPRAGDPVGGHGALVNGRPQLTAIPVNPGQVVAGINVALTQTLPYDPPSFVIAGGSQVFDQSIDRPQKIRLQIASLTAKNATFAHAHFGVELDLDAQGNRQSTAADGLDDVFPRVFLRQIRQLDGTPVAPSDAAIVPCRAVAVPVLPALLQLAPGAAPLARDALDVFVEPLAVKAADLSPLPKVPTGTYQVIVVEKSGQVWTLPNQLGDPARQGTPYYAASQAQTVTFDQHLTLPDNSISGNVVFHGNPAQKTGNVIVQAYAALPYAPPPPLGAALPVRVLIIRAQAVNRTADGFTVPYRLDGLPAGNYVVQALDDVDGNFSPLDLLQTPTRGDLVGAVIDPGTLRPAVIPVNGVVGGKDVTLAQTIPLDPPAFEIDPGAQMGADAVAPVRFGVTAKPLAFPMAAGSAATTAFTVALVRDSGGKTVDADGDGLPDVWPRAFLVRLDASDPTGLTQAHNPDNPTQTVTQVIPAAVDPTPFLPALLAGGPTATLPATRLTVVARPALLDATDPTQAPVRLPHLVPGSYKLVLINQTGQVWQVPNEAGPAALDPSVLCAAQPCAPGTVLTQSQGRAFTVTVPAVLNAGSITGMVRLSGSPQFAGAYVFAYDAANPPPPQGTGTPVSGDYHPAAEFSAGAVPYVLQNLPTTRSYLVAAVVDTRGDLALSPQLFAAAPGEGTLLGLHAGAVAMTSMQMPGVDVTVATALPPRPGFTVRSAGVDVTSDVTTLFPNAVTPQRITLHAAKVLDAATAWKPEPDAPSFLVSYQGCTAGGAPVDADSDNLPDLYPRVLVVRLSDADPSGLTPDPNTTVIPATVDPTRFSLGACTAHTVVPAPDVSVILSPAAVHFAGGQPVAGPIPAGRYGIVVEQGTGQVWRIPNELQPALLDPRSAAVTSLASQGVAIRVASQVPAALPGAISGAISLNGYSAANVGNVLVAAYKSTEPPPPQGLGRPVAVQLIPRPYVAQAAGGALPYALTNLPDRDYLVAALMDPLGKLSAALDFMATPPQGAQSSYFGGAVPAAVTVAGAAVTGRNITLAQSQQAIPFERPAFSLGSASYALSSASAPGTALSISLAPGTPAGLPYAVAAAAQGGGGYFHPIASGSSADPTQTCAPSGSHPWASTQVYVVPIDTGSTYVPLVQLDECQFCPSITGSSDCSLAPLATPQPMTGPMAVTVKNTAIDPALGAPAGVPLPVGHYAVVVVEPTGQSWTVPNDLASADATQGAVFTVTP